MDNVPHQVSWLVNQGLAVALLLLFLWASWKGIAWFGTAFLVPLRDAAIKHLSDVGQSLDSLVACFRELGLETKEIHQRTKQIEEHLGDAYRVRNQLSPSKSDVRGAKGIGESP